MKNIIRIVIAAVIAAFAFTGCASRTLESASTKLKVSSPLKSVEFQMPKNVKAEGLEIVIDPTTGEGRLTAAKLETDASTVIESASKAQAEALAEMSRTLNALVPLALPGTRTAPPPAPSN